MSRGEVADRFPHACMLVSAQVDEQLRHAVAAGRRPRPEFLVLEERFGIDLVDWSAIRTAGAYRSVARSARHALASVARVRSAGAVLSDGEHVGIPLAMLMRAPRVRRPHVMIGHHLLNRSKRPFFRALRVQHDIDRILVHSPNQLELLPRVLGVPRSCLRFVPYAIDTEFWKPRDIPTEPLVVAVGREHRDFTTLVEALSGDGPRVVIAEGSSYSPGATYRAPSVWPPNFNVHARDIVQLRELYSQAAVVVVPVMETYFPAGITTLLEAMAMGKPVVASDTSGLRGVVTDGESGLVVPTAQPARLRDAVNDLLRSPSERTRLGERAREVAVQRYDVAGYAAALAAQLDEVRHSARR